MSVNDVDESSDVATVGLNAVKRETNWLTISSATFCGMQASCLGLMLRENMLGKGVAEVRLRIDRVESRACNFIVIMLVHEQK